MPISGLKSLGETLFEQCVRLEQSLAKLESQLHVPPALANPSDRMHPALALLLLGKDLSALLGSLRDLQQRMDRVLFLHALTHTPPMI